MRIQHGILFAAFTVLGSTMSLAAHAAAVYLALPGINGEANPPGLSNVIELELLVAIGPTSVEIVKRTDVSSPALGLATVLGTLFATADAYYFDNGSSSGTLLSTDHYTNVVLTSNTLAGNDLQGFPIETVDFSYQSVTTTTAPVPTAGWLFTSALALLGSACRALRRPAV